MKSKWSLIVAMTILSFALKAEAAMPPEDLPVCGAAFVFIGQVDERNRAHAAALITSGHSFIQAGTRYNRNAGNISSSVLRNYYQKMQQEGKNAALDDALTIARYCAKNAAQYGVTVP